VQSCSKQIIIIIIIIIIIMIIWCDLLPRIIFPCFKKDRTIVEKSNLSLTPFVFLFARKKEKPITCHPLLIKKSGAGLDFLDRARLGFFFIYLLNLGHIEVPHQHHFFFTSFLFKYLFMYSFLFLVLSFK
jgi:hypothetical protein